MCAETKKFGLKRDDDDGGSPHSAASTPRSGDRTGAAPAAAGLRGQMAARLKGGEGAFADAARLRSRLASASTLSKKARLCSFARVLHARLASASTPSKKARHCSCARVLHERLASASTLSKKARLCSFSRVLHERPVSPLRNAACPSPPRCCLFLFSF